MGKRARLDDHKAPLAPDWVRRLPLTWNCRYLSPGEADKFSAGFYAYPDEYRSASGMMHPYFAFNYILSGEGLFTDTLGHRHAVGPGSLFFRFPGAPFSIERHGTPTWLEFAAAAPQRLCDALCAAKILDPQRACFDIGLKPPLVNEATILVESLTPFDAPSARAKAFAQFHRLLQAFLKSTEATDQAGEGLSFSKQAERLLGEELDQAPSLPELARRMGLGYENFRKKFTAAFGVGPLEFRIEKRLQAAEELLRQTSLSIKEIAERLGYPTDADFIRQYRRHRHRSPGAFRKSRDF